MLPCRMTGKKLTDDSTYRAGLLIGRQQSVSEVAAILLDQSKSTAKAKVAAMVDWCEQTLEEDQDEARLMAQALRDGDSGALENDAT